MVRKSGLSLRKLGLQFALSVEGLRRLNLGAIGFSP